MSIESDIRKAATAENARLWHHKGYYSIIVTGVESRGGVEWVTYFIEQNCDLSLASYEDSFVRLNVNGDPSVTGADLLKEQQFENNVTRVMSMDRAVKKFRSKKPAKIVAQVIIDLGAPPA